MSRISVCLTYYNRPNKLGATLASLAAQTRPPDEVFLQDNASPNSIDKIVREWSGRFSHFVYERNATNLGMPGNLNVVLPKATTDYVANLHDADVFEPTLLQKWEEALDAHPDAALAFCQDSRWENPRFARYWTPEPAAVTDGREFFSRYYLGRVDSIVWGTVMMRRCVYDQLLPFDPCYRSWADVDMWMRACAKGAIAYVPEQLIQLDHTPTPERRFSFEHKALVQAMVLKNIDRLFDGVVREEALARQMRTWRRLWWRWMLGGGRNGDWRRLREGLGFYNFQNDRKI